MAKKFIMAPRKLTKNRIRILEKSPYKYRISLDDGRSVYLFSPIPLKWGCFVEISESIEVAKSVEFEMKGARGRRST